MSAGQGQQVAEDVCKTLSRDRSEAAFDLFWTRLLKRKREVDAVAEPQLPRKRRAPSRQRNDLPMKSTFTSKASRQFNNYELTMMNLKGETFADFNIQRCSVFYFVIDVSSVIISMCIGLLRQRTKKIVRDMRESQIALGER